jgi:RNA polymerase-associated protein
LLPVYPVQRALSRLWITRVESEWSTKLDILMTGKGREAAISKAKKELRESIITISPIFGEKPFFMNEEFSLVDCCVAPILWRLKRVGITLPEKSTKPLQKYMDRVFEREAFQQSLTEDELEMNE